MGADWHARERAAIRKSRRFAQKGPERRVAAGLDSDVADDLELVAEARLAAREYCAQHTVATGR